MEKIFKVIALSITSADLLPADSDFSLYWLKLGLVLDNQVVCFFRPQLLISFYSGIFVFPRKKEKVHPCSVPSSSKEEVSGEPFPIGEFAKKKSVFFFFFTF